MDNDTVLALQLREEEIIRCRTIPYLEYLQTPWWNFVHDRTIKRARGQCELCGQQAAAEAHHTTYERIGCEKPDDTVALCRHCHRHVTDNGLAQLPRGELLRRRREIMHSPEFQRAERRRLEY